jgi:hypothetical protein
METGTSMATTYYRVHDTSRCAPAALLEARHQRSIVWTGGVYRRCETCGGVGAVDGESYEDEDGDVTCDPEPCPARCDGGQMRIESQAGVSVCRSIESLVQYFRYRAAYLGDDSVLVELEGEPVEDDQDVDADEGALLVRPTRIVRVIPLGASEWSEERGAVAEAIERVV